MPFNRPHTLKYYGTDKEVAEDIVKAYGKFIEDLYNAGCRNLQLDDCTWGMMADKSGHLAYGTTQEGLKEIQKIHRDINNKAIKNAPADMVINTHVCRGNFHSTYAKVSGDKKVVLGLITTKSPELENREEVIARIHEAEKYIPLDRLYLSPQCGFASCEIGNKLTAEEQWAKLTLVKEIAKEVWG